MLPDSIDQVHRDDREREDAKRTKHIHLPNAFQMRLRQPDVPFNNCLLPVRLIRELASFCEHLQAMHEVTGLVQ